MGYEMISEADHSCDSEASQSYYASKVCLTRQVRGEVLREWKARPNIPPQCPSDPARCACCWLTEPHSHAPFTFASLTLSFLSNSFTSVLAFSIASFAPGQALRPRGVSNNLHACGEITPSISKL